jgi:myo-inositol-1(or 4)-monophosphatase
VSERLELASAIAREAGALQCERFLDPRVIETKSSAIDLVTDVDRACDELIVERIAKAFPDDHVLTEETGDARKGGSGYRWIVDPLDGTTNYANGIPHFAVSIGVEREGERVAGVIYDPMRDELFAAARGGGLRLNGEPAGVSSARELERSVLATGFAYDVHEGAAVPNLDYFERFMRRARAIRRMGSAALDLAWVACGRFDGFWEMHLHAWDVAAGLLLIEEGGGRVTDFDGSPPPASGARLVASNGDLHSALLDVLR